jgi:hypothetical protein
VRPQRPLSNLSLDNLLVAEGQQFLCICLSCGALPAAMLPQTPGCSLTGALFVSAGAPASVCQLPGHPLQCGPLVHRQCWARLCQLWLKLQAAAHPLQLQQPMAAFPLSLKMKQQQQQGPPAARLTSSVSRSTRGRSHSASQRARQCLSLARQPMAAGVVAAEVVSRLHCQTSAML